MFSSIIKCKLARSILYRAPAHIVLRSKNSQETLSSSLQSKIWHMGRVGQSVQRLATGWTARGSNPSGGEIFCTCPDQPWGPPSLLYNGYRVFPGDKELPGRDANLSLLSSVVVKTE